MNRDRRRQISAIIAELSAIKSAIRDHRNSLGNYLARLPEVRFMIDRLSLKEWSAYSALPDSFQNDLCGFFIQQAAYSVDHALIEMDDLIETAKTVQSDVNPVIVRIDEVVGALASACSGMPIPGEIAMSPIIRKLIDAHIRNGTNPMQHVIEEISEFCWVSVEKFERWYVARYQRKTGNDDDPLTPSNRFRRLG